MAEFDAAGFSAIDEFFGENEGSNNVNSQSLTQAVKSLPKGKLKRGGVGLSISPSNTQNDLSQKLLRVGSKRSRAIDADDDNAEIIGDDNDDDDDEAGRTGISEREKKMVVEPSQKRKLGKKERKRLKQIQEGVTNKDNSNTDMTMENNLEAKEDNNYQEASSKKKQKRRKIRSRQKNIRKDNREEKPKHLIPGTTDYQGRPLTEETRSKLNLPSSSSKTRQYFVVDKNPVGPGEGVMLGVEDLLNEESKPVQLKKTNKKKKKKKYKNL